MRLPYETLDVFTTTPLSSGNPLAVVTPEQPLEKAQEHLIAREFNYSETVFIYNYNSGARPRVAIWTTTQELPFAGHPTIGAAWHLANTYPTRYADAFEIETLAGVITVGSGEDGRMKVEVPTKISVWESKLSVSRAREVVGLDTTDDTAFAASCRDGIPVVSLVDGLAFALIEVPSVNALSGLSPGGKTVQIDALEDLGAASFIGAYCYVIVDEDAAARRISVRSRMFFDGDKEDPAAGSAACALASYLALARGSSEVEWKVEVTQGVEMGRRSEIGVSVTVSAEGKVQKVVLEGAAVSVMKGTLTA
ncbi:hypothetical protein ABW21_db0200349 [Orbilia brochopaga]|nr:hypothetical protein ABW21_db0200349 [Drechslerella brochopaga]